MTWDEFLNIKTGDPVRVAKQHKLGGKRGHVLQVTNYGNRNGYLLVSLLHHNKRVETFNYRTVKRGFFD